MKIGKTLLDIDLIVETYRPNGWYNNPWKGISSPFQPAAKDAEPQLLFKRGYAVPVGSAKKCNFAGTDCWTMRVHPRIDKISAATGYLNGGQELTITGWDLEGTKVEGSTVPSDVTVMVAGKACSVTASTSTTITCLTGKATAVFNR